MEQDRDLSVAFSNSLRSTVVSTILPDGNMASIKRIYVDSATVEHHLMLLKQTQAPDQRDSNEAGSISHREIPIFLFSLDLPIPVFVDRYFQAVARPSMVIAVQSRQQLFESFVSCNGKSVLINSRDPLRSIISSVATLLGGLIPTHVTSLSAHHQLDENWMWSVGAHVLSATSTISTKFSQIHIDAVHRGYVLQALRHATSLINAGVSRFSKHSTSLKNTEFIHDH
eukprot:TRINITY_DN7871_c0_g1_i3.p1 TRINITY_DN7871_c0_g1~~TRINITY_DN7871_c0_g1_i3.p1  ORF type:complete len:227 (-),score=35.35 TRINITY_DN7871_c0_g1_i3:351-1031(-)